MKRENEEERLREGTTLLTTADVARLAGVTPEAVRGWERRGHLPSDLRTLGGTRLFKWSDVQPLLIAREERGRRVSAGAQEAIR